MNRKLKFLFTAILIAVAGIAMAQQGTLKGQVIDDELNEGLFGATVYIEGTTIGAVADFDGNYVIQTNPGTYNIVFSSVSFQTITITGVVFEADAETELSVRMKSDLKELEAVVVSAEIVKDSDMAMLTMQKKSTNVLDGISAQAFSKAGDANLSSAIKRVTGVSVEDGKYVYVRGLGDRYVKTSLNGMDLPGLDPDKNSVQIDVFPTSILDNVVVYKTFTPDLFGDFTGGMINVETKAFPEEKTTNISVGLSHTFGQNLNGDYILYDKGSTDWLAFDDGGRSLPFDKLTDIPHVVEKDPELEKLTRSFNPQMAAQSDKTALPNGRISFSHGNQFEKGEYTFGYNAVLDYQNRNFYYNQVESNRFLKDTDQSENELFQDESRRGQIGQNNVLWSALVSGGLEFRNHEFSLGVMRSQNGESNASSRVNQNYNQTGATLVEDILTYNQRELTSNFLNGKHKFEKFELQWNNALTWSRVYDPDFRQTAVSITDGDTTLQVGDGAGINRFYRDLNEFNESFKLDFIIPLGQESKIKTGALATYKKRDFEILNYLFRYRNSDGIVADADWFFLPENIWTVEEDQGTYVIGNYEPTNTYESTQNLYAAYAMAELYVSPKLRTIFGARAEQNYIFYSGQNNTGSIVYDDEKVLDELNILPSAALIYNLSETTNLRGSYSRTLARPSFKEKSIAQIYDPISRRTFSGNIDLDQTDIDNFDLRYEAILRSGEMFSVSGFYKGFSKHIELVSFDTDPDNVKPRNSGDSRVYGAEVEFRKSLDFVAPSLSNFFFGANVSIVRSAVDLHSVQVDNSGETEYELRQKYLREGETLSDTRSMSGQAPYLINTFINYRDEATDLNINLSYNVQGETLFIIGSGRTPDVYTVPYNSLNFNAYRSFGAENQSKLTLGVDNILNAARTNVYKSFGSENEIYSTFSPGTNVSVKYSYSF